MAGDHIEDSDPKSKSVFNLGDELRVVEGGWSYIGRLVGLSKLHAIVQVGSENLRISRSAAFTTVTKPTPAVRPRRTTAKEATK